MFLICLRAITLACVFFYIFLTETHAQVVAGSPSHAYVVICNSIKYPFLLHERDFFQDPPPLWKFQLCFIHFFKFFGHTEPMTPQEIPISSVGGVWIFSGTAQ